MAANCRASCRHRPASDDRYRCRSTERCLHLVVSSGRYARIDGSHGRVPLGCYKVGRVASAEEPKFVTNDDGELHLVGGGLPQDLVTGEASGNADGGSTPKTPEE